MSLQNAVREQEEARKAQAEAVRSKHWGEYRELLEQADQPRKGDDKRVAELAEELGLDASHIELHIVVVRQAQEYQHTIDAGVQALARLNGLKAEAQERVDKIRELEAQTEEHREEADSAHQAMTFGTDAEYRMKDLRLRYSGLLAGDEHMADGVTLSAIGPSVAVQEKERELGL